MSPLVKGIIGFCIFCFAFYLIFGGMFVIGQIIFDLIFNRYTIGMAAIIFFIWAGYKALTKKNPTKFP